MERLSGLNTRSGGLSCVPWSLEATRHFRECSTESVEVLAAGRQIGITHPYTIPLLRSGDHITGQHSHPIQQQQINTFAAAAAAAAPRSLVSPNWRISPSGEVLTHSPTQGVGNCVLPSLGQISRGQLGSMNEGYAYYLDRGNGELTRLIPADVLPPLNEIPAREMEGRGMVVLPPLRAVPPKGAMEMNYPVTIKRQGSDPLQKHIDRIIATSPPTPKKVKIYCDKWIHEGVCAFTQQGCKYKHEMPFDEVTQHSLGLFQGLPSWWKKRQEDAKMHSRGGWGPEQQTPRDGDARPLSQAIGSPVRDQLWQNGKGVKALGAVASPIAQDKNKPESCRSQLTSGSVAAFVWGPIGPPQKSASGINPWGNGIGSKLCERGGSLGSYSPQGLATRKVR